MPAAVLTTACLGVAALVYAPVIAVSGPLPSVSPAALAALVTVCLVCTALAFVLFFRLITEVGRPRSTLVAYLNPVVAVALGAAVLHEPLDLTVALATVLIVGGSAAASLRTARHAAPAPIDASACHGTAGFGTPGYGDA